MEETKKDHIISLNIPETMYQWLEEHKDINRSDEFRNAILKKMYPSKHGISPLVFFVSTMGLVFSVVLIGIGLSNVPFFDTIRQLLPLLGGILAVATALLYYKERKKV